jgi:hypothetical protein
MDEMEIDSSMKKIKKLATQDALKKWETAHEKWRKGIFTRYPPLIHLPVRIKDLVDEILSLEDIPEELLNKISKTLGERWLRIGDSK